MTLLIINEQYALLSNFNCWVTVKERTSGLCQILEVRPLFKGVHYSLGFPLPAPINQGRTVFKGVYYSRICGTQKSTCLDVFCYNFGVP